MNYGQLIAHGFIRKPISAAVTAATASATASAAAAAVSAERAVTAWAASTAPAEAIAGKSQILHQGTIVASCIDLPSKHSDGGAWIDRCSDKSWYNETLGGTNWLNTRCGSEAIARAVIQSAAMPELAGSATTFDSSTGLTVEAGWTISGGVATSSGVSSGWISIPNKLTIGRKYAATLEIKSRTSGSCYAPSDGAGGNIINYSSPGVYVREFTAGSTTLFLTNSNSFVGSIDNISVKEVDTTVSAAGYVYQSSADNKFYSLTGSSGQSEVFRGIKREYPRAGVVWIAEAARVVGYDLGSGAMWMVFAGANAALYAASGITSIAAGNGHLLIGQSAAYNQVVFTADTLVCRLSSAYHLSQRNIANRQLSWATMGAVASGSIVNNVVNSVAITVLDKAPIDPATGLPVPTIAVATAGGVSVILDSGSVNNITYGGLAVGAVAFDPSNKLIASLSGYSEYWELPYPYQASTASPPTGATVYSSGSTPSYRTDTNKKIALNAFGGSTGLGVTKENPTTPANGMVAYVTEKYNSGWQVGAIKGAYLADTTAETVTGVTVLNSTFTGTGNLDGWSLSVSAINNSGVNVANITSSPTEASLVSRALTVEAGRTYVIEVTITGGTSYIYVDGGISTGINGTAAFSARSATTTLDLVISANDANQTRTIDNISVKLAEPDRSVKNKGLIINGSLTKTAVASGAGLVAYSGFSAANYLEQPPNTDLDVATGDFSVMGWVNLTTVASYNTLCARGRSTVVAGDWALTVAATTGYLGFTYQNVGAANSTLAVTVNSWALVGYYRTGGKGYLTVNGVIQNVDTGAGGTVTDASATFTLGAAQYASNPTYGSLALWRISATAPSADQIAQIYRDELPLFQPGAQCTLAGTSPAITALSYDEDTGVLHAGTSYGRSSFKGLLRVESEATTVGSPTSIAASGGHIVMGGTSARVYTPAKYLRDELQRKDEAKKALGRIPVFLDFTATSGQTAFIATKGYRIQAVYKGGTLMRESTTGTYWTRSHDGYQETATLSVGATTGDWVSLMLVRV